MAFEHYCSRCHQRLRGSQYKVEVLDNGKLRIVARCCGHEATFVRAFDMAGVLFTDLTPGTEGYREEWERLAGTAVPKGSSRQEAA